jgi:hypothetical protein
MAKDWDFLFQKMLLYGLKNITQGKIDIKNTDTNDVFWRHYNYNLLAFIFYWFNSIMAAIVLIVF